jgi:hypothetical protein
MKADLSEPIHQETGHHVSEKTAAKEFGDQQFGRTPFRTGSSLRRWPFLGPSIPESGLDQQARLMRYFLYGAHSRGRAELAWADALTLSLN